MARNGERKLRSAFLTENPEGDGDDPFRHSFLMQFPPADRRALLVLARLLHFKEDLEDAHFPTYRRSHNLAHLRAAALDMDSVARSLAFAADLAKEELSERELAAARLADRYAVKAARLAREIDEAIAGI